MFQIKRDNQDSGIRSARLAGFIGNLLFYVFLIWYLSKLLGIFARYIDPYLNGPAPRMILVLIYALAFLLTRIIAIFSVIAMPVAICGLILGAKGLKSAEKKKALKGIIMIFIGLGIMFFMWYVNWPSGFIVF
jgi:hypothetical protein